MSEIITGDYVPTMWRRGPFTVTRQTTPQGCGIQYTIANHVRGGAVTFTAGADYLGSYHNEDEIAQKWTYQKAVQKAAHWPVMA
jgi:hypothetical protein